MAYNRRFRRPAIFRSLRRARPYGAFGLAAGVPRRRLGLTRRMY